MGRNILSRRPLSSKKSKSKENESTSLTNGLPRSNYEDFGYVASSSNSTSTTKTKSSLRRKLFKGSNSSKKSKSSTVGSSPLQTNTTAHPNNVNNNGVNTILEAALGSPSEPTTRPANGTFPSSSISQKQRQREKMRNVKIEALRLSHSASSTSASHDDEDEDDIDPAVLISTPKNRKRPNPTTTSNTPTLKENNHPDLQKFQTQEMHRLKNISKSIQNESKTLQSHLQPPPPIKTLTVQTECNENNNNNNSDNWDNIGKTPQGGYKIHIPTDTSPRPPPTPSTLNLPSSPQKRKAEMLTLTRSALSRPFGRTSLPAFLAKKWLVEVSPGVWEEQEKRWKYRIVVQKEEMTIMEKSCGGFGGLSSVKQMGNGWVSSTTASRGLNGDFSPFGCSEDDDEDEDEVNLVKTTSSVFTTASTVRTLQDFAWLEAALVAEYHGALLLPVLSDTLANGQHNSFLSGAPALGGETGLLSYLEEAMDRNEEVDGRLLADWLSDVLNGVRGHGEVLLNTTQEEENHNVIQCEAMETFLYRNTERLYKGNHDLDELSKNEYGTKLMQQNGSNDSRRSSNLENTLGDSDTYEDETRAPGMCQGGGESEFSFFQPFACFVQDCGGGAGNSRESSTRNIGESSRDGQNNISNSSTLASSFARRLPLNMLSSRIEGGKAATVTGYPPTSPRRIGTLGRNGELLSPNEAYKQQPSSSQLAIHSELLEAERTLVQSHLHTATTAKHELKSLLEEEGHVSAAWKRFAISLSNLFAFEKDLENSRVGAEYHSNSSHPHHHRDNSSSSFSKHSKDDFHNVKRIQPFKKLSKSVVDDLLRILARQKMDRSMPSLKVLSGMLNAFIADLSSVDPALKVYSTAVERLAQLNREDQEEIMSYVSNGGTSLGVSTLSYQDVSVKFGASGWQAQLRAMFTGNRSMQDGEAFEKSNNTSRATVAQKRAFEERVVGHETLLKSNLTALCRASPIRTARMAWKVFKMEAGQASLLDSAASSLRSKISVDPETAASMREMKKIDEGSAAKDDEAEIEIVRRILEIGGRNSKKFGSGSMQLSRSDTSSNDNSTSAFTPPDNDEDDAERAQLCEKAIRITSERVGRWDAQVALAIMEAVGVEDAEVRVEETTRDLRFVRKYAIGLRENVDRCVEAVQLLSNVVLSEDEPVGEKLKNVHHSSAGDISHLTEVNLKESRGKFLSALATVFSGVIIPVDEHSHNSNSKSAQPSTSVLASVGIDTTDPAGWRSAMLDNSRAAGLESFLDRKAVKSGNSGKVALDYLKVRDKDVAALLSRIAKLLLDYEKRVEEIESFVYMHCVGIQLEKHFSNLRSKALAAWEKKTDITTAINIATRKRLPLLVKELQSKLEALSPHVSHTTVKHAKEKHLASKNLKTDLQSLADRRFQRAKETATERVIAIMAMWAQHEENNARRELETLGETIREIERAVTEEHIEADGGAHLFAAKGAGSAAASLVTASRSVR